MPVTGFPPVDVPSPLVNSAAGKNQVVEGAPLMFVGPFPLSPACGTLPPPTDSPKNQLLKATKNVLTVDQIVLTNCPGLVPPPCLNYSKKR